MHNAAQTGSGLRIQSEVMTALFLILHPKARQHSHGRADLVLSRPPPHMGCPVGEAAGRADPTGQKSNRLLLAKSGPVPLAKGPALVAENPGPGMHRASDAGSIVMSRHSRQEVHVPDDVGTLHAGQDVPGVRVPAIGHSAHSLTRPFLASVGRRLIWDGHQLAES